MKPQGKANWLKVKGAKPIRFHVPFKGQAKPKKPIAFRSKSMVAKMKIYNQMREAYLTARPYCFACKSLSAVLGLEKRGEFMSAKTPHAATEIHHRAGRGANLLREETWAGVCRAAHLYIHANPATAKRSGLLL